MVIGHRDTSTGTVNMSGGTLTVQTTATDPEEWRSHFIIGNEGDGTLNMSGGTIITEYDMIVCRSGHGDSVVNMTGGTINVGGKLDLSHLWSGRSTFNLDGGVVTAIDLWMNYNAKLNLIDGVMILDGNKEAIVQNYISLGRITAYDLQSAVFVDYDVTNPGKTTIMGNANSDVPPVVDAGS